MAFRSSITIKGDDPRKWPQEERHAVGRAISLAMARTTESLKEALRQDVLGAGLGQRFANTWRAEVYPRAPRFSPTASGRVWSNAEYLVEAFDRGVTIRGKRGNFLAIPTKDCPPTRRDSRGAVAARGSKMTPEEVEQNSRRELVLIESKGRLMLVMPSAIRSRNGRSFKPTTTRRLAQGRDSQAVVMFFLVPIARMPKKLDAEGILARAEGLFENEMQTALGEVD